MRVKDPVAFSKVRNSLTTEPFNYQQLGRIFSEEHYLRQYPYIADSIKQGAFANGFEHYLYYGQYEDKTPNPFFDPIYYRNNNPEIETLILNETNKTDFKYRSEIHHFLSKGQFEHFTPNGIFNEKYYLRENLDVQEMIKNGQFSSGCEHFMIRGHTEPSRYFPMIEIEITNENFCRIANAIQLKDSIADDEIAENVLKGVSITIHSVSEAINFILNKMKATSGQNLFIVGQLTGVGFVYDFIQNIRNESKQYGDEGLKTHAKALSISVIEFFESKAVSFSVGSLMAMRTRVSPAAAGLIGGVTAIVAGFLYDKSKYQEEVNNRIRNGMDSLTEDQYKKFKLSADCNYICQNIYQTILPTYCNLELSSVVQIGENYCPSIGQASSINNSAKSNSNSFGYSNSTDNNNNYFKNLSQQLTKVCYLEGVRPRNPKDEIGTNGVMRINFEIICYEEKSSSRSNIAPNGAVNNATCSSRDDSCSIDNGSSRTDAAPHSKVDNSSCSIRDDNCSRESNTSSRDNGSCSIGDRDCSGSGGGGSSGGCIIG